MMFTVVAVPGDDNNYGSASMLDVAVLQALSKRIHYGMFVAEAKFRCGVSGSVPSVRHFLAQLLPVPGSM